MPESSWALMGMRSLISRIASDRPCSSLSVAETVLRTPAKALSKSMADFTDAAPRAAMGVVSPRVSLSPRELMGLAMDCSFCPSPSACTPIW